MQPGGEENVIPTCKKVQGYHTEEIQEGVNRKEGCRKRRQTRHPRSLNVIDIQTASYAHCAGVHCVIVCPVPFDL